MLNGIPSDQPEMAVHTGPRLSRADDLRANSITDTILLADEKGVPLPAIAGLLIIDTLLAVATLGLVLLIWKLATGNMFYGLLAQTVEIVVIQERERNRHDEVQEQALCSSMLAKTRELLNYDGCTRRLSRSGKKPINVEPFVDFKRNHLKVESCYDQVGDFFLSLSYFGYLEDRGIAMAGKPLNPEECGQTIWYGRKQKNIPEDYYEQIVRQGQAVRNDVYGRIGLAKRKMNAGEADLKREPETIRSSTNEERDRVIRDLIDELLDKCCLPTASVSRKAKPEGSDLIEKLAAEEEKIAPPEIGQGEKAGPDRPALQPIGPELGENPDVDDRDFFLGLSRDTGQRIAIVMDGAKEIIIYDGCGIAGSEPSSTDAEKGKVIQLNFNGNGCPDGQWRGIVDQYFIPGTFYSFLYEDGKYYAQRPATSNRRTVKYRTAQDALTALDLEVERNCGGGNCCFHSLAQNWERLGIDPTKSAAQWQIRRKLSNYIRNEILLQQKVIKNFKNGNGQELIDLDLRLRWWWTVAMDMQAELEANYAKKFLDYGSIDINGNKKDLVKIFNIWYCYNECITSINRRYGTSADVKLFAALTKKPMVIIYGMAGGNGRSGEAQIMVLDSWSVPQKNENGKPLGEGSAEEIKNFITTNSPIIMVNTLNYHWESAHPQSF